MLDPIDRSFSYDPTNIRRPLQGQSDFVANLKFDVYLNKLKTTTIGLYYNYFGDRIFVVGANGTPDAYERGVGLTDIVFSHKMDDKLDFKFMLRKNYSMKKNFSDHIGKGFLFRCQWGISFRTDTNYPL
ncbi:hypothetical protein CLV96_2362 [Leptospira meyeri]|uniref:TonB-dependent receptor n=1 Tax=Leptospira meyeri TaxID=29508 RepID=A0A4R8N0H0_LEPME|nr:hypothetical protein [Leptospira meyeri]EKJ88001.1 hypothetical protein LEP1GSC017_1639 [Leptospira meyeri serovar Hardjo str. Went 5]TDY73332.1 hypothetical protein CLV96_2362 [Leptospira meyeri]